MQPSVMNVVLWSSFQVLFSLTYFNEVAASASSRGKSFYCVPCSQIAAVGSPQQSYTAATPTWQCKFTLCEDPGSRILESWPR